MRWIKRAGMGLLVLVVMVALLWTLSRARGATAEQRAALALMHTPNGFEGRNAFDAMWVLPYDVPEAELATVVDADIRVLASAQTRAAPLSFSSAAARYSDLRTTDGAPAPCGVLERGCLAKVGASTARYAAAVEANRALIERVEGLAAYQHHAWRLPWDANAPMMPLTHLAWPLTSHAVLFHQGERMAAVDATCRDLATWRRLSAQSDTLIVRMFGAALTTDGYGSLLAEMLAAMPADAPLPVSCRGALAAPRASEASVCPAMRGEFAWSMAMADTMPDMREPGFWARLVLDRQGYASALASEMAPACEAADNALAHGPPFARSHARPSLWRRFECVANSTGCILADIAGPAYDGYIRRGQDHHARLQLLGTLAWLHDPRGDGTLAARLARRPAELRSPTRDVTVSADGRELEIAQYDTGRGASWSLSLPAYLVESPVVSD